jgi:hypothetical protein
VLLDKEAV